MNTKNWLLQTAHSQKAAVVQIIQKNNGYVQCLTVIVQTKNKLCACCDSVRDLDAFVYLLSKLSEDNETVGVLQHNAQALQMPMDKAVLPASGSKMSDQEVSEVMHWINLL